MTLVPAVTEIGEYVPFVKDCNKKPDPLALGTLICTAKAVLEKVSAIPSKM